MDVTDNFPELSVVANHVVKALVLPEWPASLQPEIGPVGGEGLEARQGFHQRGTRRDQQMDMIGHHHECVGVKAFQFEGQVVHGDDDDAGDLRLAEPRRATGRFVERPYFPAGGPEARPTERGVTLLEMLVVVGIVAILMGVSYPSVAASIDAVRLATAADSTAAFLNSALNRAEQRHQVLELTIARGKNELTLRSADPTFVRKLEYPTGVKIAQILPGGEDESRVFYLIPGGSSPRVGVQLVNERGAKRTVRLNPITGAPEIERE